jgi:hypothetical protein
MRIRHFLVVGTTLVTVAGCTGQTGAGVVNAPGATIGGSVSATGVSGGTGGSLSVSVPIALHPSAIDALFGKGASLPVTLAPADVPKVKAQVEKTVTGAERAKLLADLVSCEQDPSKVCRVVSASK